MKAYSEVQKCAKFIYRNYTQSGSTQKYVRNFLFLDARKLIHANISTFKEYKLLTILFITVNIIFLPFHFLYMLRRYRWTNVFAVWSPSNGLDVILDGKIDDKDRHMTNKNGINEAGSRQL